MKPIFDWTGFTSWYLLPTIACGTHRGTPGVSKPGGWCYLLWGKGRIGFFW